MKISEDTNIGLPIKNLIAIIFFICTGLYAFFTIQERLNKLETADTLFQADLLKKSEQLPTDQEQFMLLEHIAGQVENIQKEMETMRNNNVNINYAMKDIEKIKDSLEQVKDKVRKNGSHQ